MSVDTNGHSASGDGDSLERGDAPAPARQKRPSALIRAAGPIPEGCDVDTSLDAFIAEANSVRVDMDGWSLQSEPSPDQRNAAHKSPRTRDAEREERTRQAVLAAVEEARAAAQAEAARRLAHVQRMSAAQVAELEARLALAEERMADAEERARFSRATSAVRRVGRRAAAAVRTQRIRRRGLTPGEKFLFAGLAVFGVGVAVILLGSGDFWGHAAEQRPPPAAASPAPEPVVRSILPDEPTVTPLDDGAVKGPESPRPERAKKPAGRSVGAGSARRPAH